MSRSIHPRHLFLIIPAGLLLAYFAAFTRNCDRPSYGPHISHERQLLEPAESAGVWIARLEADLKHSGTSTRLFSHLYAELPPMADWPAVCDVLEKLADDKKLLEELNGGHFGRYHDSEKTAKKLRLFAAMLREDGGDHEPALRDLIGEHRMFEFHHGSYPAALMMVSKEREATVAWLKAKQPPSQGAETRVFRIEEKPKPAWEVALAENRVEDGIEMLNEAIAAKEDLHHHYSSLIRIGLVLDRMPLVREASAKLSEHHLAQIRNGHEVHPGEWREVFEATCRQEDWASVIGTFDQIFAAYEASGNQGEIAEYKSDDKLTAARLTALHLSGKPGEFDAAVSGLLRDAETDPKAFFTKLNETAAGQAPLGVHLLESSVIKGDTPTAIAFAKHILARFPRTDAFYEQLLKLDATQAAEFFTALHAYDPFEERPLIWLAEAARRKGDLTLAEATIRKAIALDPSDGDHGKDSRMFCYEVLARILEDGGRKDQADGFRKVVDSIRQGEAADDFLHAGLIGEATRRYGKALEQFGDAYCLQSRLAMTLARNGRFEESVGHFKKAFSLMPVSFGPRESHCLGCEGIFSDERVADIARPLLEAFEKENPGNARTPYLLGLMFEESDDHAQAVVAFRRALKLDPAYYNAATRLLKIYEKEPEYLAEAEGLREDIFRIAPYPEKSRYIPGSADLRAFWELTARFPPSPLKLPPLPFASVPTTPAKQHIERKGGVIYWSDPYDTTDAIDGWSPSELRRTNRFLHLLDGIQ